MLASSTLPPFRAIVMCPPDHFDVVEASNPFMQDGDGLQTIDREKAKAQWEALVDVYLGLEVDIDLLEPTEGLPDQVFTCDPVFSFPDAHGRACHLESVMRWPIRAPEVDALSGALRSLGSRAIEGGLMCEGAGDMIWHHRQRRIWMGHGFRTDALALAAVRRATEAPVTPIRLVDPQYYHLTACLSILDDDTALWVPKAFDEEGRAEIQAGFKHLIDVTDEGHLMAANAFSVDGQHVIIDGACTATIEKMAHAGFIPVPVDTSEFRKSGGSVSCMKQVVW